MIIGTAVPRVEGRRKVTGDAKYSADHRPTDLLYAVLAGAPIASGELLGIDDEGALALPGVVSVMTRHEMPRFGKIGPPAAVLHLPMQTDDIRYEGEPVALVLAETLEAAEDARDRLVIRCRARDLVVEGHGWPEKAPRYPLGEEVTKGDIAAALDVAVWRIEQTYVQPARHHNAIETSCTIARFDGDRLTLWDSVQAAANVPVVIEAALGIKADRIRLITPHTGGGFGAKGYVWPHQILCVAAAQRMKRPVKLQLSRSHQYTGTGHQPWIRQRMTLGADSDGRLTAIRHEAVNATAMADTFFEPMTVASTGVYSATAIETRPSIERVNIGLPTPMRAPVEGPGLWALESGMNELAAQSGIDPLELRLRNYAEVDPIHGKPWSSKKLREAYDEGARLFGWSTRHSQPKHDGYWRLGRGMATSSMGSFRFAGSARVTRRADGSALVEVNSQDIGTGMQTVCAQIVADELQIPLERVSIAWGDSQFPATGPVYGSSATMHTGSAVALACREINERSGGVRDREVSAIGTWGPPGGIPFDVEGGTSPFAVRSFGAVFIEVAVDPELGIVRLRRAVGAYSAGRIMNAATARSQMIGALTWGWGKATMEESIQEPTVGRWLAKNLSNVAVPVNADIPSDITIHFVDEVDVHASAIGARGLGELGATGVDAAVADAVHDAVGVRLRTLPITPLRILEALAV